MDQLFINVKPNLKNQLSVNQLVADYVSCKFKNPEFRYTNQLDRESAMDVIVMVHADRLMSDLKLHDVDVSIYLTKSK